MKPKISVVTPVYNQAAYIEQTIDSVLSQNVEGLEYIILDGGSTDGTSEIIKRYDKHLSYWHSKPDNGQSQALVDGFAMAKGEIQCWINGDDYYLPGVLDKVVKEFTSDTNMQFLYGDYLIIDEHGKMEAKPKISFDFDICLFAYLMIPQPSSFWRKNLYDSISGIDSKLNFAFDWDMFLRMGKHLAGTPGAIRHEHDLFSVFRLHTTSKSVSQREKFKEEAAIIRNQFPEYRNAWSPSAMRIWHLARALSRYRRERNLIPLGKDKRKA